VLTEAGFEIAAQAGDPDELGGCLHVPRRTWRSSTSGCPRTHTVEGLVAARRILEEHPGLGVSCSLSTSRAGTRSPSWSAQRGVGYLLKDGCPT